MRIAVAIELASGERDRLISIAQSRTVSVRLAERAAIVVLAADGVDNTAIGEMLGIDRVVVGRWRNRFAAAGFAGIERDQARGGRPAATAATRVIALTTQGKPGGATQWSVRTMAEATGISKSSISRIWQKHGLKPHRIKHFKVSRDPAFVEKLEAIVGLYMSPPEHALVLCLDEKSRKGDESQVQALDRTQPGLPMKPGRAQTMTHDYKRHGTTTLFAAMSTLDGTVISQCAARHRHQKWLAFLKLVERETPKEKTLYLICDNYATHKHPKVLAWLDRHPRIHVCFTPTSASWLNMVERFFRSLTVDALRRGVFTSVAELQAAIENYVRLHNQNPKAFVWTAKANDILQKVIRANSKLSSKQNGTLH